MRYVPWPVAVVDRTRPVSWLVTVTVAPGSAAPVWSRAVPVIAEVVSCACAASGHHSVQAAARRIALRGDPAVCLNMTRSSQDADRRAAAAVAAHPMGGDYETL